MSFEFAEVCRFVAAVAADVRQKLTRFVKRLFAPVQPVMQCHQLALDLQGVGRTNASLID